MQKMQNPRLTIVDLKFWGNKKGKVHCIAFAVVQLLLKVHDMFSEVRHIPGNSTHVN